MKLNQIVSFPGDSFYNPSSTIIMYYPNVIEYLKLKSTSADEGNYLK